MFVFKAYDSVYEGLHGMYKTGVVDTDRESIAHDVALEYSLYVLDDYRPAWDAVEEKAENYIEMGYDEDVAYDEARSESVGYLLFRVREDCPFSYSKIDDLIYHDFKGFVEEWCYLRELDA